MQYIPSHICVLTQRNHGSMRTSPSSVGHAAARLGPKRPVKKWRQIQKYELNTLILIHLNRAAENSHGTWSSNRFRNTRWNYNLGLVQMQNLKFQNYYIKCVQHMHGVLNLNKIKKIIAQFVCKLRDKSNEPKQVMIRH